MKKQRKGSQRIQYKGRGVQEIKGYGNCKEKGWSECREREHRQCRGKGVHVVLDERRVWGKECRKYRIGGCLQVGMMYLGCRVGWVFGM